jgi:hypothetical protein
VDDDRLPPSSTEPSKWNLIAWIWWKLGEPPALDDVEPIFHSLEEHWDEFPPYLP